MENSEQTVKIEAILAPLDDVEKKFVMYYCTVDMCKSKAAIYAGRSEKSAKEAGYNIYYRPDVTKAVKEFLTLTMITPEENISLIAKTASTKATDYFTKVKTIQTVRVRSPLAIIIRNLEFTRDVEDEYLFETEGLSKIEQTVCLQTIKSLEQTIRKYKIELSKNLKATRFEYIEKEVEEEIFDIKKAVREKAPIKSLKYTDKGLQVEMYSAADAQNTIGRVHGSFEKDNDQLRPVVNNNLSSERIKEISDKLEKDL